MRRAIRAVLTAVAAATMLSACGGDANQPTVDDLLYKYFRSTHVKNDIDKGATSADRLAEFAAEGGPRAAVTYIFAAYPCTLGPAVPYVKQTYADACPTGTAGGRARDFAGEHGRVYTRRILIRHHEGGLELGTVYVAQRGTGRTELLDAYGFEYDGLEEFRQHNELLDSDDWIVTLRAITSVPGHGRIVAVTGHTARDLRPWLYSGLAVAALALAAVALLVARAVRRRRRPDPLVEQWLG